MRLDQDFSEFIELLLANDVAFMVVGGYAVAAMGTRATRATSTSGS
jgi:hypothetical protein